MPGRSSTCAWSFHTLRGLAREIAVLDDLAEQVDGVRIGGSHGHVTARLPVGRGRDRDLELAGVEAVGRGVDLGSDLPLAFTGGQVAGDRRLAGAGANCVGDGEVIVENDPELDDSEEQ